MRRADILLCMIVSFLVMAVVWIAITIPRDISVSFAWLLLLLGLFRLATARRTTRLITQRASSDVSTSLWTELGERRILILNAVIGIALLVGGAVSLVRGVR